MRTVPAATLARSPVPISSSLAAATLNVTSCKRRKRCVSALWPRSAQSRMAMTSRSATGGPPRTKSGKRPAMLSKREEYDVSDPATPSLREECGVVGVLGDPEAANLCYLALFAQQHRGQEGCGIIAYDKLAPRDVD